MGFFDENPELVDGGGAGGGAYVTKDEKIELINSGQPFKATRVVFEPGQGYEGADRHAVTILLENEEGVEEERVLAFNVGVPSRESFLEKLSTYLEDPAAEPVALKLTKVGRSQILVAANA